eukprot:4511856-Prorocentrum_lima.AAC.1
MHWGHKFAAARARQMLFHTLCEGSPPGHHCQLQLIGHVPGGSSRERVRTLMGGGAASGHRALSWM